LNKDNIIVIALKYFQPKQLILSQSSHNLSTNLKVASLNWTLYRVDIVFGNLRFSSLLVYIILIDDFYILLWVTKIVFIVWDTLGDLKIKLVRVSSFCRNHKLEVIAFQGEKLFKGSSLWESLHFFECLLCLFLVRDFTLFGWKSIWGHERLIELFY
jgi:hypothetical protein